MTSDRRPVSVLAAGDVRLGGLTEGWAGGEGTMDKGGKKTVVAGGVLIFTRAEGGVPVSLAMMEFGHFLRIERDGSDDSRHYVVHLKDPKFSMELLPDHDAPDHVGKGVIKRICIPNSCIGDYTKYSKLVSAAQEFFKQSFSEPAPKNETRRFQAE